MAATPSIVQGKLQRQSQTQHSLSLTPGWQTGGSSLSFPAHHADITGSQGLNTWELKL